MGCSSSKPPVEPEAPNTGAKSTAPDDEGSPPAAPARLRRPSFAMRVQPGPQTDVGSGPVKEGDPNSLKVCALLGEGAYGYVQLVTANQKFYALKTMHKGMLVKCVQLEGVTREVEIMKQLKSPFIVRMHASYQDDYHLYILLEFARGGELFTLTSKYKQYRVPFECALASCTNLVEPTPLSGSDSWPPRNASNWRAPDALAPHRVGNRASTPPASPPRWSTCTGWASCTAT